MREHPDSSSPSAACAPRPTAAQGWRRLAGWGYAALAIAIFAGWFVVTRFTVTHQLRAWDVTALRFGGGALLLLPVLARQRLSAGAWAEGLLYAGLWGAPFVLLVAAGLQLTTAAVASSIVPALMPVFAGVLGWAISREVPGKARLLGYAAIVAGLVALLLGRASSTMGASPAGFGVLGLAAATWAIYSVRFRRSGLSALQAAALICFWSALLYLPLYWLCGLSRLGDAPGQEIVFQLVYQGVLMSGIALFAYNRAVSSLGAGAAAAMMALVPVLATLLAIPVLGEVPSPVSGIAIAIIALGVALAARTPVPRHASSRSP